MLQSKLLSRISKELPKDETSYNAQILIKSGFIDKVAAGIYTMLPLGLKVHNNICRIIRQEMDLAGGQEILMPALLPKENWQITGRWDDFDALFKLKSNDEKEYALGATHEEIATPLAKKYIFSYKELPVFIYQIQTKFRNELRAKAGLIRGREFSMKDLYSFHESDEDLNEYYKLMQKSYFKIFDRCGLLESTFLTYSSGGSFSKYSHEFQTITEAGEDTIYICDQCNLAINEEIIKDVKVCQGCGNGKLRQAKSVEVGNIFKLGSRYTKPFGLGFMDKNGQKHDVLMGCYGIGIGRLIGTIAEICHDKNGMIWPEEVAPFKAHLLAIGNLNDEKLKQVLKLYHNLTAANIETLYDDRQEASAGEKFAESDLIGCPYRLVASDKTLKEDSIEVKKRNSRETKLVKIDELIKYLKL